jgi:hypothetical protein
VLAAMPTSSAACWATGEEPISAMARYHQEMRPYGFAAVRAWLATQRQACDRVLGVAPWAAACLALGDAVPLGLHASARRGGF